jgi:hypothetical protein
MPSSSDVRGPVEHLADEFLAHLKRGEKPTIGEYCAKHPELAEEIPALLIGLSMQPGRPALNRASLAAFPLDVG